MHYSSPPTTSSTVPDWDLADRVARLTTLLATAYLAIRIGMGLLST